MMNSYYSNLIEGHNTRPLDIEKALTGVQIEPEKRPLALEAKAHASRCSARSTRRTYDEQAAHTSLDDVHIVEFTSRFTTRCLPSSG